MRVGLLHLGQSVDFVVSITFLRSPVLAILAIAWVFLLRRVSLLTRAKSLRAASTARSKTCLRCPEEARLAVLSLPEQEGRRHWGGGLFPPVACGLAGAD
jgi:hypothetical protein